MDTCLPFILFLIINLFFSLVALVSAAALRLALAAVRRLLPAVASPGAERRPAAHRLSSCGTRVSVAAAHGLSFSVVCRISPDPCPLHRQANPHSL